MAHSAQFAAQMGAAARLGYPRPRFMHGSAATADIKLGCSQGWRNQPMSKIHTIVLLLAAAIMLSGCLVIESDHIHRTDHVQGQQP
jgi:hypothetical protein